jgi:hypothetical protein
VLEVSRDGLEQGARAAQNFIPEREQARRPLFLEFGEELPPLSPELREESLGEGAALPFQG